MPLSSGHEIHECSVHHRRRRSNNNGQSDGGNAGGDGDGSWTSVHINALDGIVRQNSLFTGAVFTGLNTTPSSISTSSCSASNQILLNVVSFSTYSLSLFLFSSLIALSIKQTIRTAKLHGLHAAAVRVDRALLRSGLMATALGSVIGVGFLVLAIVDLVQIKLGRLGCGGAETTGAVVPLVVLGPAAMLIYTGVVLHAFSH